MKLSDTLLQQEGLSAAHDGATYCGTRGEYTFLILMGRNELVVSVLRGGEEPDKESFRDFVKARPELSGCKTAGTRVIFSLRPGAAAKSYAGKIHTLLPELLSFLHENGYENCCEISHAVGETVGCMTSGVPQLVAPALFTELSRKADQNERIQAETPENIGRGILGALIGGLSGAAAIVHYASVRDGAGSYIMPDTLRYDEENKKTILVDTPFEWNNPISFDTEGRTKGKVCGMRLGWLPEGWGTGYTQTAYDVIAQRDAEQAQSLPQDERELVVYTYDLFAVQDVRKDYSVQCMSANTVAGCDFLCGGTRTEITKQGTIGPYDASWVETHWQHASPGSDAPEEWTTQMLLLYDREKLCVVIISADWDDAERIAANLEIVETSVDAPQPDLTNGRGFRWIGGVG